MSLLREEVSDDEGNRGSDASEMMEQDETEDQSMKRKLSPAEKPLKKRKKTSELYKLPTRDELNELREAEMLYHSGLFRMQVTEMMKEIKPKEKWRAKFQQWMDSFKKFLFKLPESECYKMNDLSWLPKKVKIPIWLEPPSLKGQFKFLPPTKVKEVGSYALDITCSKIIVVDVAIEVPKVCWVKTDFLNHAYHRKRAMYLAYMVKFFKKSGIIEDIKYSFQHDNFMKPVLVLTPKGDCSKHFSVCLLPYPEENSFKLNRFIPCRNNVRPSWLFKEEESSEVPTPVYNSTILADILMPDLSDFLQEAISSVSVKDGIVLLKVWSAQRGLDVGYRGFTGFIFAIIVAYLLHSKKIVPLMSPYQVFRNALLFISKHNWFESGVTLCKDIKENQPSLENFQEMFDVVFVDPSGYLNVFSHFERETFSRVCHEAEMALKILDTGLNESFSCLFLEKVTFCRKFDCLLQVSDITMPEKSNGLLYEQNDLLNHGNNIVVPVVLKMLRVLRRSLGKRIVVMDIENKITPSWSISAAAPNPNVVPQITFGFLLDPESALNTLEKGPVGTDPKAVEFREFWGDKAELRRFRDGSIHEAVLFPAETIGDQRSVVAEISKYILQRHCGINPDNVHFVGSNMLSVLSLPKKLLPADDFPSGTGEQLFSQFMKSFTALSKQLRTLDGLPLLITSIQGVSAAFRFSEVIPPLSVSHIVDKKICYVRGCTMVPKDESKVAPHWVPAFKVIVHLEGSGKWPDDKVALKTVQASFHLELAARVKSMLSLTAVPYVDHVDILKDGYAFRLEVACHKEITLLKQVVSETGAMQIKETKEARELEKATEILPKLNSVLRGLHQQHNSYGTACRLGKRWIAAQLLGDYIEDVSIELLMAFIYVSAVPYTVPSCPQIAFHRFLALLCTHDWKGAALIVNLNNQLTVADVTEIQSNFTTHRSTLSSMCIATPLDKNGCLWTREKPTPMILDRLITVAKASLETLESQIYSPSSSDFKVIFRPPLDVYDVVIHLNPLQIPKRFLSIDLLANASITSLKKYHPKSTEIFPVVECDRAQIFVEHLRENFDEFAYFFHDIYGGNYIAVLWKPNAFKPQPLKIYNAGCHKPTTANADGSLNVVPSVEDMFNYISDVGTELVTSIERRIERWTIA